MTKGVYLLHFSEPTSSRHTTQHYIGYADCIERRTGQHQLGLSGAKLIIATVEKGIEISVVRTWANKDRTFERRLKNRHGSNKLCPICAGLAAMNRAKE